MAAKRRKLDTSSFRDLYCDLMEEIKRRIEVISQVTEGRSGLAPAPAYEMCYLQLRLICELIALGCLAAHGDIHGKAGKRLLRDYNADRIIKGLSKLHTSFYPRPTIQINDPKTGRPRSWKPVEDGFLSKEDLLRLYGECGNALHRGSFENLLRQKKVDLGLGGASEWKDRIVTLLNHHQIQLVDPDQIFVVLMQAKTDGKVHGAFMIRENAKSRTELDD